MAGVVRAGAMWEEGRQRCFWKEKLAVVVAELVIFDERALNGRNRNRRRA